MRDERGVYYYPHPAKPEVRVYVRDGKDGDVEFRLWEANHPEVWINHEWVPFKIIERASEMYRRERNSNADPLKLYDLGIAIALLNEKAD